MKKKMKRNMKKNMKKKILLSVVSFSLAVGAGAHDDLIYRTQAGWNFDIGNQSVISQTLDAVFTGGACVGDYDGDGRVDICEVETTGEMIKWVWKINNGKKDWITSTPVGFGISATDKYVTGDFNGDQEPEDWQPGTSIFPLVRGTSMPEVSSDCPETSLCPVILTVTE